MGRIEKDKLADFKGIDEGFRTIAQSIKEVTEALTEMKGVAKGGNSMLGLAKTSEKASKEVEKYKKQIKELNALSVRLHAITNKEKLQKDKELNAMSLRLHQKLEKDKETARKQALVKEKADAKALLDFKTAMGKQQSKEYLAQLRKEEIARQKALKSFGTGAKKVGGLTRSFRNLTMSLRNVAVAYLGFQTLIRGFQDIFKVTKILDSITFAQEKVIKSQVEFAQTQKWLSQIIGDYGLDLVTVTNRYTKFRAATISSNLSAMETQKIFGSMSKAAATLGLKTDELQGVYLALEQMISKNKVTTEELRRQLGERLPGAFDIMAKSMGVTTSELNDMLKAGEVMSEEVLPAFADAVEEAYGIKSVQFVDTLVAAQNRLRTAWIELIKIFNAGDGIKGFLNSMANSIKWIGENITLVVKLAKVVVNLTIVYFAVTKATVVYNAATKALAFTQKILAASTRSAALAFRVLGISMKMSGVGALVSVLGAAVAIMLPFLAGINKTTKAVKSLNEQISDEERKVDLLFDSLNNAKKGTEEWNYAKQQINSTYGKYIDNLIDEESSLRDIEEALKAAKIQTVGMLALKTKEKELYDISEEKRIAETESWKKLKGQLDAVKISGVALEASRWRLVDVADAVTKGELTLKEGKALLGKQNKELTSTNWESRIATLATSIALEEEVDILKKHNEESEKSKQLFKEIAIARGFIAPDEIYEKVKNEMKEAYSAFLLYSNESDKEKKAEIKRESKYIDDKTEIWEDYLNKQADLYKNQSNIIKLIQREREKLEFEALDKQLETAEGVFKEYELLRTDAEKAYFTAKYDFITKDAQNEKEYLEGLLKLEKWTIQERIRIRVKLGEIKTKKGSSKDPLKEEKDRIRGLLKIQEDKDKADVSRLKTRLEENRALTEISMKDQGATQEEIARRLQELDSRNKIALLNRESELAENRKVYALAVTNKLISLGEDEIKERSNYAKQIAKIDADLAKKQADITQEKSDRISQINDNDFADKQDLAERRQSELQAEANAEILILEEKFAKDVKLLNDKKLNDKQYAEERLELERKLQKDILQVQLIRLNAQLRLGDLDIKAREHIANQIIEIKKAQSAIVIETDDTTTQKEKDNQRELDALKVQLANEFFEFGNAMFNNRLQRAEEQKNWEVALAGNSLEGRLIAERKYEKESAKLKKQQAIAAKAQEAFNIVINTASGIVEAKGNPFMIALIASIGALSLAKVLAEPIPQFFDGGEHKGGLLEIGEDKGGRKGGSELITLPSGDSFLSPDSATLMDLPSGTHIDSHSETQRILANATTKTAYEGVSMSRSEGYLKEIRDKGTIERKDGYKIVTRKGFYGKYRTN